MTISVLTDNVLLEIFDFYQHDYNNAHHTEWKWHLLVHVCQRWRQIIFASPHRLNLRILCTDGTPVRKNLGIWPAFPISICSRYSRGIPPDNEDNVIAALEHPDRLCHLQVNVTCSQLEKMATVMQVPFLVLAHLRIGLGDVNAAILPADFLGGSAPHLRTIYLNNIPFPALPTLLLSTSGIVSINLHNIPATGYISPEAMVSCLAALPKLEFLVINFQSAILRPDRIRPPPVRRTVLPALTYFEFAGAIDYLEDLVAHIDSPQLDEISVDYLKQRADFQVPQFANFIDRSGNPKSPPFKHAHVTFFDNWITFDMYDAYDANYRGRVYRRCATIIISCKGIEWQVLLMAEVLSQLSATLSDVVHLELKEYNYTGLEGVEDVEWLDLLYHFSTAQTLHVCRELGWYVAPALENLAWELVTEVMPSLNLICIVGQPASSVEEFVAAHQRSGHPITIINTETEFYERVKFCVSE